MSRFVINKCEYAKVAGYLAAIVNTQDYYREPVLRLWNKRESRLYNEQDVIRDMFRLYEINAAAVQKQYRDAEPAQDPEEYHDEYNRNYNAGAKLMHKGYCGFGSNEDRKENQRVTYCVISFFSSVLYQIEDEDNHKRALRIMNKYYRGLYAVLRKLDYISEEDSLCWGNFHALEEEAN